MRVTNERGGGHRITAMFSGEEVELVYIRPVGTLMMSKLAGGPFSEEWVPEIIEALQLARKIASRPKPWEPWDQ